MKVNNIPKNLNIIPNVDENSTKCVNNGIKQHINNILLHMAI